MSKAYYRHRDLCDKYQAPSSFSLDVKEEEARSIVLRAALSLVVLATFSHRTKLEDGAVNIEFAERFSLKAEKEVTPDQILQCLASQLVSLRTDNGKEYASVRGISGSSGFVVSEEVRHVFTDFLADPVSAVPEELQKELRDALGKKAKSINKRFRNYDNELARRDRGRKSRAITSLTKVLADLDPEFRELCVRALRHNRTTTGKYGQTERSLQKLHNALNTILSGNNLENWQDEDVIPEAERLASVAWVMGQ